MTRCSKHPGYPLNPNWSPAVTAGEDGTERELQSIDVEKGHQAFL